MKIILLLLTVILIFSCREGVIEPENFVGNVNEPIQINQRNSYTFLVNAEFFSMELSVPATFSSSTARITITLIDHESGYVNLALKDSDERERYRHFIADDVDLFTDLLDGFVLKTINIRARDFSGKLKIELRRVF